MVVSVNGLAIVLCPLVFGKSFAVLRPRWSLKDLGRWNPESQLARFYFHVSWFVSVNGLAIVLCPLVFGKSFAVLIVLCPSVSGKGHHACTHKHTHEHTHARTNTHTHAHKYARMRVCVRTHTRTQTTKQESTCQHSSVNFTLACKVKHANTTKVLTCSTRHRACAERLFNKFIPYSTFQLRELNARVFQ